MSMVLRPYELRDRSQLIQAIDAVCGEGQWMGTTRFSPTPAWNNSLQQPQSTDHLLLLAVVQDVVVGWCRVFLELDPLSAKASLGVGLLAPYRDRGIGTNLVQRALDWAWSADLQHVMLTTHTENRRAVRVFERCGFEVVDRAKSNWMKMTCSGPG